MSRARFSEKHLTKRPREAAAEVAESTRESAAGAVNWLENAVDRSPMEVCLTALAVGVGIGVLLGHAVAKSTAFQPSMSPLESFGRRAFDTVMDHVPANVARTIDHMYHR